MPSIFNDVDRTALSARLHRLAPDMVPRWGRMRCAQMLAHVTDGVRMALGDLAVRPRRGPLRFAPLRHAIIYWLPFPKDAPTAPELLTRCAEDCASEVAALEALLTRMAARAGTGSWPEHPAFGRLSERDWGVVVYRHIDHHLRQFGT
jgi:hypothetical protein